jgi:hypothetical protein
MVVGLGSGLKIGLAAFQPGFTEAEAAGQKERNFAVAVFPRAVDPCEGVKREGKAGGA